MIPHLNLLDVIILVIILSSFFLGLIKGFVRELLSLAFFVTGLIVAYLYYPGLGAFFNRYMEENLAYLSAFISLFFLVIASGALVTFFIRKMFLIGPIRLVDRLFGGIFGFVRGLLIVAVILFVWVIFNVQPGLVEKSSISPHILQAVESVFHLTPKEVEEKKDAILNEHHRQKIG